MLAARAECRRSGSAVGKRCPIDDPSYVAAGDGELNEPVRSASLLNSRDLRETIYLEGSTRPDPGLQRATTGQAGTAVKNGRSRHESRGVIVEVTQVDVDVVRNVDSDGDV
jgi:hypothetical protein